ncbi:MAG: hypothetical protein PHN49_07880, partial [Candidatus Omnitrophica bacterium]|nr:hypothetical protein [Candidatus Omnitrophota bacterium]
MNLWAPVAELRAEESSASFRLFKTRFTEIAYSDDQALSDFLWRISGKRLSAKDDLTPAKSRLDEIVERVQTVLDMHPENFQLKVRLYP